MISNRYRIYKQKGKRYVAQYWGMFGWNTIQLKPKNTYEIIKGEDINSFDTEEETINFIYNYIKSMTKIEIFKEEI